MKRLTTEIIYLLNRVIFGLLFVPGILWAIDELLARYYTGNKTELFTDYYLQFYSRLDSPVTWLWVVSPYLIFLLVRPRSHPNIETAQSSRRDAANTGHRESVKSLINADSDIQASSVHWQPRLHLAAMTDNVAIVHMIIDGGADVNVTAPENGIRPLHIAATKGCVNVCEFLLKHGADMDAQTAAGDTALHLAAANKHLDVVSLLLSFHADPALKNNAGVTAAQTATARGYTSISDLIQQHSNSEWQYPRTANRKAS